MRSQPLVSVCIPAYNGAAFIQATIQAVLNQTLAEFEVVVSDDKSVDETVEIVKAFNDPRIFLIQNQNNLGLGGNWNRTLSSARGKYVKLLCEDDLLRPECLEHQVGILEEPCNKGVALTTCARDVINERNQVILKSRRCGKSGIVKGSHLIRNSIRAGTNLVGEPVVGLFRHNAMRRSDMCDPSNAFLSDLSLWAELLKWGDAFVDHDCLASFRISRQAASSAIGLRQAASFRAFALKQHREGAHQVGRFDVLSGCVLSVFWCFLRNALVRSVSRSCQAHPQTGKPSATCTQAPLTLCNSAEPCCVRKQSCLIRN